MPTIVHLPCRMHASCPCFLDMAMHQHDVSLSSEDGILPGSTHIELLDTEDEGGSSAPLEKLLPTDSTLGLETSQGMEYGGLSLPSLQIPGHGGYAYALAQPPSRTLSPTTESMHSGQSAASIQLAGSCGGFFGVATSRPASAEAAAFASCGTSVLNGGVGLSEQQQGLPSAACLVVPSGGGVGDASRRAAVRPRRATTATAYMLDALEAPQCPLRQASGKKRGSGTQAGKLAPNPNGHACTACGAQVRGGQSGRWMDGETFCAGTACNGHSSLIVHSTAHVLVLPVVSCSRLTFPLLPLVCSPLLCGGRVPTGPRPCATPAGCGT